MKVLPLFLAALVLALAVTCSAANSRKLLDGGTSSDFNGNGNG
jgi:hypothetical protein